MPNTAAQPKPEPRPYVTWDTCDIARNQAEFLKEQHKEETGEELDDDKAFQQACEDWFIFESEWDSVCECLTELMTKINPNSYRWRADVSNFGWRKQDGYKSFKAEDGKKLFQEVLPNTECTFEVWYEEGDEEFAITNRHHDSPCGGERYVISLDQEWKMRAVARTNEDGDDLYWSKDEADWVTSENATIFSHREKKDFKLPPAAAGECVEWEEFES